MNYKEEILSHYNDDKGMIAAAIAQREARLEKERIMETFIAETRHQIMTQVAEIFEAFTELEIQGLLAYDDEVEVSDLEDISSSITLTIPSIDTKYVVELTDRGTIVEKWLLNDNTRRQSILMDATGSRLDEINIFRLIMDTLEGILDLFIDQHDII